MAESIDARYNYGNLLQVSFDYKKINDHEQPVMILSGKTDNAYQIPLDAVYKYAESDLELVKTASRVSYLLGMGTEKSTVFRVGGIIENHLEELVRMPPVKNSQSKEKDEQGRMTFSFNGQEITV